MGEILLLEAYRNRRVLNLPRAERMIAESLLKVAPDYRYECSGLPRLDPAPAPGPESAAAAAKVMMAWVKSRRVD